MNFQETSLAQVRPKLQQNVHLLFHNALEVIIIHPVNPRELRLEAVR